MHNTSHTQYYLGFNLIPGMGSIRLARLIDICGSVKAAWHATPAECTAAGIDSKTIAAIQHAQNTLNLDAERERVEQAGVTIVTVEDSAYPSLLTQVPHKPHMLYVRGAFSTHDDWAVAVVGTRSPTSYGKEVTHHIVSELVRHGITIVSGLARGIDTAAHMAAIEAGGRTIAVQGCGVDIIYPRHNQALAHQIIEQGAVVSEYPLGSQPQATNFPPRNRIISGLSLATLVIEAGKQSGALITADFAVEQGRDVFATPGSIFNRTSVGTHRLLQHGAALITSADDIVQELHLSTLIVQQEFATTLPEDPTEMALLEHLSAEPQHVDVICRASGLSTNIVSSTLALLELKGYVRQVGFMEFVRR